ncbi:MAG: hypothetical protein OEX19_04385, partial [Gammaproteobacteria bacterium]|nr:hypothetical protein [Gammaproteobacteria bacterium]
MIRRLFAKIGFLVLFASATAVNAAVISTQDCATTPQFTDLVITDWVLISSGDVDFPIPSPVSPSGQCMQADFDGDGILDLLIQGQKTNDDTLIYKGQNEAINGSQTTVYRNIHQRIDNNAYGLDWAAVNAVLTAEDLDGDGKVDIRLSTSDGYLDDKTLYASSTGNFGTDVRSVNYLASADVEDGIADAPGGKTLVVGSTNGELDVLPTGGSSYSTSLVLPPGINGMQPSIGLSYASSGGNGQLGVGWALSGIQEITRCPKTIAQDNVSRGVTLTNSDRFCLNGQRLVLISGSYGGNGAQYKTEIDSNVVVTSHGSNGYDDGGPDYFAVEVVKTGEKIYFGSYGGDDDALDVLFDSTNNKHYVQKWAIKRRQDVFSNYITYNYWQDFANQTSHYLTEINYTGNVNAGVAPKQRVVFEYAERNDPNFGYRKGAKYTKNLILKNIKTFAPYAGSESLVRNFYLYHSTSTRTNRSLVSGIQECAVTECFKKVSFEWKGYQNPNLSLVTNQTEFYKELGTFKTNPTKVIDLDGNGTADTCTYNEINGVTTCVLKNTDGTTLTTTSFNLATKIKLYYGGSYDLIDKGTYAYHYAPSVWQDINGDNIPDHCGVRGKSFKDESLIIADQSETSDWDVSFAGDEPDEVYPKVDSPQSFELVCALMKKSTIASTGEQTVVFDKMLSGAWVSGNSVSRVLVEDIDTDGDPDICYQVSSSSGSGFGFFYCGRNNLSSNSLSLGSAINLGNRLGSPQGATGNSQFVDINGDGLGDACNLGIEKASTYHKGQLLCSINKGMDGFDSVGFTTAAGTYINGHVDNLAPDEIHFNDVNGDGDFEYCNSDTGTPTNRPYRLYCLEFENGKWDVMPYSVITAKGVAKNGYSFGDVLSRHTNSSGVVSKIGYSTTAEYTSYYPNSGNLTKVDGDAFGGLLLLVESISVQNGKCPTEDASCYNKLAFQYETAIQDKDGRGFQGFVRISESDSASNQTKVTQYKYGYPLHGTAELVEIYTDGIVDVSSLLTSTDNDWSSVERIQQNGESYYVTRQNGTKITNYNLSQSTAVGVARDIESTAETRNLFSDTAGTLDNLLQTTRVITDEKTASKDQWCTTRIFDYSGSSPANTAKELARKIKVMHATSSNVGDDCFLKLQAPGLSIPEFNPSATGFEDFVARETIYSYNAKGHITEENTSSLDQQHLTIRTITKSYDYDLFGHNIEVTTDSADIKKSISRASYLPDGYFMFSSGKHDSLNDSNYLAEIFLYDNRFGTKLSTESPGGLTTEWTYDEFGRVIEENRPNQSSTTITRTLCSAQGADSCNLNELRFSKTTTTGEASHWVFYDKFDRKTREMRASINFTESAPEYLRVDYKYAFDSGKLIANTKQHVFNPTINTQGYSTLWVCHGYDQYHRKLWETLPSSFPQDTACDIPPVNQVSSTSYEINYVVIQRSGLTKVWNTETGTDVVKSVSEIHYTNAIGKTYAVTHQNGGAIAYSYSADGKLKTVVDSAGNLTNITYDDFRHKASSEDPDKGLWTYTNDVLGRVLRQTDGNGDVTLFDYDSFGRLVERRERGQEKPRVDYTVATLVHQPSKIACFQVNLVSDLPADEPHCHEEITKWLYNAEAGVGKGKINAKEIFAVKKDSLLAGVWNHKIFRENYIYNSFGLVEDIEQDQLEYKETAENVW